MIKAFLLDWGGVMSNGGRVGELEIRLAEHLGITTEAAHELLKLVWVDYVSGQIDDNELWHRLEVAQGKPIIPEQRDIWNKWEQTSLLPEMGNLVSRLKQAGYRVGLVSNTIPDTADEIRRHGGYDIFDFAVLSYEVKAAKPDKKIYELAMEHLSGLDPSEVVFIDDQERCLVTAREMGMATVLAKTADQAIQDVESFLSTTAK